MRYRSIDLRLWLPVIVTVLLSGLAAILTAFFYLDAESNLYESNEAFLARDLALLQREMNYQHGLGNTREADHALSARGTNVHFEILVSMNTKGRIMHSTRLSHIGKPVAVVSPLFDAERFESVVSSKAPELVVDEDNDRLIGYYPLQLLETEAKLRPSHTGLLFAVYELATEHQAMHAKVARFSLIIGVFVALVVASLVVFLRRFVSQPAEALARAAASIANGTSTETRHIRGSGEFASIARSFDDMERELQRRFDDKQQAFEALEEHRSQLESVVAERTKQLEASNRELSASQQKLIDAQRIAHVGSWVHDLTSGRLTASEELRRIFELRPTDETFSFNTLLDCVHPGDRERVAASYKDCINSGEASEFEYRLQLNDGRIGYIAQHCATAAHDVQGHPSEILVSARVITQHRLGELQLLEAKEQAEAGNAAKSAFLRNISHELRTPLHAIMAYTDLSLKRADNDRARSHLQNIKSSALRLTAMLNDLIDISALERKTLEPNFAHRDLVETLRNETAAAKIQAADKALTISVDTPESLHVEIDERMVGETVKKLLSNAIQLATPGSDISVSANARKDGHYVDISIASKGAESRAIELASKLNETGNTRDKLNDVNGAGISLAVCHEFVALHNGSIRAETNRVAGREQGYVIHVTLPLQQVPAEVEAARASFRC